MTLLKCATLVVADVAQTSALYVQWMDYTVVEQGAVDEALAALWLAPGSAGRPYAILQPASGAQTFLRFVEGSVVPEYEPIRTYGWAATELCVTDVDAVHQRMIASPFEVIGPPRNLDGFATVKPMQVKGGDKEVVYLTQMLVSGPEHGLPEARSLVDRPFIMVLACPDLRRSADWVRDVLGLEVIEPVAIHYSMISNSFNLPEGEKVELVTGKWQGEVFIELDQYPPAAKMRPQVPGELPPGVAITTMAHPHLARLGGHWAVEPVVREGVLYAGRRVGMLRTPEGALLEVIEGDGA
jgi:catechol 2,3-dioxygenase-like lactoylglutathione lyase family enzyme